MKINFEKLLSMNIKELNNYILNNCDSRERKFILNNRSIREKYFDFGSYNNNLFAFFLGSLLDDVKYLYDEDSLDLIFKNDIYDEDRLRAAMIFYPEFINKYSYDNRVIEKIVNSDYLIGYVDRFDIKFGKYFLYYIISNNMISKFLYLDESVQIMLLEEKSNLELLKKYNVDDLFISSLNKDAIANLIKDNYFVNRIIDMDIKLIDDIARKGAIIPSDNKILDKYLSVDDISLYRRYIENLHFSNSNIVSVIEEKRKKEYDRVYQNVTSDGLLKEYKIIYDAIVNGDEINTDDIDLVMGLYGSHENIFKFLYNETCERLHFILIDRYFEDIPKNFLLNLEMIINFNLSLENKIIDDLSFDLYNKIFRFKSLSIKDKISLYNDLNNGINHVQKFYDDYRKCRDYAYSLYNDRVIKIDKMNKSDLSFRYGVDVYELNGEVFNAYVHQTKFNRYLDDFNNIWDYSESFEDGVAISISMINQNHYDTIYGTDYVCFGFSNLDIDRIMHVYHTDSFTKNFKSDRVNEILTTDNLMENTKAYNEIFYLENNHTMKNGNKKYDKLIPSYLLCYDMATDLEIKIAKAYNIPIVVLNTDKYQNINDPVIDYNDNIYLTGYENKKK